MLSKLVNRGCSCSVECSFDPSASQVATHSLSGECRCCLPERPEPFDWLVLHALHHFAEPPANLTVPDGSVCCSSLAEREAPVMRVSDYLDLDSLELASTSNRRGLD